MDNIEKMDNQFICEKCSSSYKNRSGLCRHNKKCNGIKPKRGRPKSPEKTKNTFSGKENKLEYILNKLNIIEKELEKAKEKIKELEKAKELDNNSSKIEENSHKPTKNKMDKLDNIEQKQNPLTKQMDNKMDKLDNKMDNKMDKLDNIEQKQNPLTEQMDNKMDKLDIIEQKQNIIKMCDGDQFKIYEEHNKQLYNEIRKNKSKGLDIISNIQNLSKYNLSIIHSDHLIDRIFSQYKNDYFYFQTKNKFAFYKMDNEKGYLDNRAIYITSDIQQTLIQIYISNIKQLYKHISPYDADFNIKNIENENDIIQSLINLSNVIDNKKLNNTIQMIIQKNNTKKDNSICDIKKDDIFLQEEYKNYIEEDYSNILSGIWKNYTTHKEEIISFLNNL